ncbi:amidohydrolase [Ruania halotolerans]|uniref:amidohydrolase n=1 Tax=Ruania halotolerans TaxID=2897773 RepID=UPI001E55184D|nr:amidohydrolase [Ruania halotolerans]UFU05614.1 amidohydrolase [Ruania halotolerans]
MLSRSDLTDRLSAALDEFDAELIAFRRDVHAHPELARTETRTCDRLADRFAQIGLTAHRFSPTGLAVDIDPPGIQGGPQARKRRRVALRADLDALPVQEATGLDYASTVRGVSHSCGHDVHTTVVLGAGLALARLAQEDQLAAGVRLIFQPAEEVQPGGALDLLAAGALEGVDRIFAVHCDPKLDVGYVGTRIGPITSASDTVTVTIRSSGGHTSRPHLTGDVVYALGLVATMTPAVLGRRLDPRTGVNLTWGAIKAGTAPNAIPTTGTISGTLRCLDVRAWDRAESLLHEVVDQIVAPAGVEADLQIVRGVPPVDNDAGSVALMEHAAAAVLGEDAVQLTEQSLGGEDFGWYLTQIRGAMARLGTRTPGGRSYDLHQPELVVDERAIGVGARLLAHVALDAGRNLHSGEAVAEPGGEVPVR